MARVCMPRLKFSPIKFTYRRWDISTKIWFCFTGFLSFSVLLHSQMAKLSSECIAMHCRSYKIARWLECKVTGFNLTNTWTVMQSAAFSLPGTLNPASTSRLLPFADSVTASQWAVIKRWRWTRPRQLNFYCAKSCCTLVLQCCFEPVRAQCSVVIIDLSSLDLSHSYFALSAVSNSKNDIEYSLGSQAFTCPSSGQGSCFHKAQLCEGQKDWKRHWGNLLPQEVKIHKFSRNSVSDLLHHDPHHTVHFCRSGDRKKATAFLKFCLKVFFLWNRERMKR